MSTLPFGGGNRTAKANLKTSPHTHYHNIMFWDFDDEMKWRCLSLPSRWRRSFLQFPSSNTASIHNVFRSIFFNILFLAIWARWWVGLWICFPICCCSRKMGGKRFSRPTNRQLIEFEVLWYVDSSAVSNQICSVPPSSSPTKWRRFGIEFPQWCFEGGGGVSIDCTRVEYLIKRMVAWACLFCATWGNLCKINIRLGLGCLWVGRVHSEGAYRQFSFGVMFLR